MLVSVVCLCLCYDWRPYGSNLLQDFYFSVIRLECFLLTGVRVQNSAVLDCSLELCFILCLQDLSLGLYKVCKDVVLFVWLFY